MRVERIKNNIEDRIARGENLLWFGISYLDDALIGISKSDLILIGAYSGSGKTELVTSVAIRNVEIGKRVCFMALEAEEMEIENRILYRLMTRHFYSDSSRPKVDLDYGNWLHGFLPQLSPYDILAQNEFIEKYPSLVTFYKPAEFGVNELISEFTKQAEDGADLIIIDHAHYFDWGEKTENEGLKNIVITAQALNKQHGIPIILVAHLRKMDYKTNLWCPSLDDFHGSSELYKRATKAVTIGSGQYYPAGHIDSYMNAAKIRFRGEASRITGKIKYNFKTNTYEREYEIGEINQKRDKEFKILERTNHPKWCINARSSNTSNVRNKTTVSPPERGNRNLSTVPYKD